MGKDGNGLHHLVVNPVFNLHEHQRKYDRQDSGAGYEQHIQENRVEKYPAHSFVVKQELEILQPHPLASPDTLFVFEVLFAA